MTNSPAQQVAISITPGAPPQAVPGPQGITWLVACGTPAAMSRSGPIDDDPITYDLGPQRSWEIVEGPARQVIDIRELVEKPWDAVQQLPQSLVVRVPLGDNSLMQQLITGIGAMLEAGFKIEIWLQGDLVPNDGTGTAE